MVFKIKNILIGGLILIFLSLVVFAINSTYEGYRVDNDGLVDEIDEWSVCREITNNCDADLFVPTATSGEWESFRTYYPSGCASCTDTCSECDNAADCETIYPSCSHLMDCRSGECCDETGPFDPNCPATCPI